jgi:hypothetical protein
VTTIATFSDPGDYVLRVQANDASGEGGGGFQCCWTNAHVKVTVTLARPQALIILTGPFQMRATRYPAFLSTARSRN